jgi:Rab-like protein 3
MTKNEPLTSPSWTVGVSLEVKLHEYKGGTPQQKTYFVDLWDIGGSSGHRNTRSVFYNGVNGIVLVHDLSNRKSEANLHKWLLEIFNRGDGSTGMGGGGGSSGGGHGGSSDEHSLVDDFDPEQFMGSSHPPILVIGTKLDSYSGTEGDSSGGGLPTRIPSPRPSSIAQECGAEEIFLVSGFVIL